MKSEIWNVTDPNRPTQLDVPAGSRPTKGQLDISVDGRRASPEKERWDGTEDGVVKAAREGRGESGFYSMAVHRYAIDQLQLCVRQF
jgi:hypothetical protein